MGQVGPATNPSLTSSSTYISFQTNNLPTPRTFNPFQNYVATDLLSQPTVTRGQLDLPYPQFLDVYDFRPALGSSSYHAFQGRLEKRFSNGLTLLASFTGGKLIDNIGGVLTSDPAHQNIRSRRCQPAAGHQLRL